MPPVHPPAHDVYSGPMAPWTLRGSMLASLWRVPAGDLPASAAAGTRRLSLAGQALAVTALACYERGGTLSYHELLFAVGVRAAGIMAPTCTVGPIWVDNGMAAAGGRSLWGIPKRLARFDHPAAPRGPAGKTARLRASVSDHDQVVATLDYAPRRCLALPVRFSVWTVQDGRQGPLRTRCTVRGRLRPAVATWAFDTNGPLAFLHGRQPLASVRLEALTARFGV